MTTHAPRRAVLTLLAAFASASAPAAAGPAPEVSQDSQKISGTAQESGVAFASSLISADRVAIDVTIGSTQIHADIDYALKRLAIRSSSRNAAGNGDLSARDIKAFGQLRDSLQGVDTRSRHGEALASFLNLMANAPSGALDINAAGAQTITSLCGQIGQSAVARFTLRRVVHRTVTVGPACYVDPALGRCGAGSGPDSGIGLVQRFTQECLNHDQCCVVTGDRFVGTADVCGKAGTRECIPEFRAAAPGFFFAPDCGTTAGAWRDNYSNAYSLTGGDSSGVPTPFSGTVQVGACGAWPVAGVRTGKSLEFSATNPAGESLYCPAWFTYSGAFSDCGAANGSWFNASGGRGAWTWTRTSAALALSVNLNASAPIAQGPAYK